MNARRVLVIGASSGIGRAVALAAAREGASVALAARRADLLDGAAVEIDADGGTAMALPCDVREPGACEDVVTTAARHLGGLDALVYATGTSPLVKLSHADAGTWQEVLETNLTGAALATAAALPHLREAGGRVVYLSSSSVGRPYPGLVAYAASKAALDEMIRGWRAEHMDVGFIRVVVGPTVTGFADGWDPDLAGEMFTSWSQTGYAMAEPMLPEQVADEVVRALSSPVLLRDVEVSAAPSG
jgi:NAD(P)-dependent dehydrogenase (short-subunit alcohol dehydrogenase family)